MYIICFAKKRVEEISPRAHTQVVRMRSGALGWDASGEASDWIV